MTAESTTPAHNADSSARPRMVHLGTGNFARAHTIPITHHAGGWSITGFTGRSAETAKKLQAQDLTYGLVVRGPESDEVELITAIDAMHAADDEDALREALTDPATAVVTLTITEKGYAHENVDDESSMIGRLARALRARREAGVDDPIAVVSCDNLFGNGDVLRSALTAFADDETAQWMDAHVDVISTMVDRITPRADESLAAVVKDSTGFEDAMPVVTEPFWEWVIEDSFHGERPAWENVGVQLTDDLSVHETRKLRLLNAAHSLMAYAGQIAGCERVDEAIAHEQVQRLVHELWAEAITTIDLPDAELEQYTHALQERFDNPRLADALIRIAADGSEKLRVRALPVIDERGGAENSPAVVMLVAAWTAWVTERVRNGHEVDDPRSEQIAEAASMQDDQQRVEALLQCLGSDDQALRSAVLEAEKTLPRD